MTQMDFLQSVAGYVASQTKDPSLRLGTIDPAYDNSTFPTTLPKVTFDGESAVSGKRYPVVGSYLPAANNRVVLAPVGSTYVIIGALAGSTYPVGRLLTYSGVHALSQDMTLTADYQDLPGTSVSITTRKPNAKLDATAVFDLELTGGGTSYILLGNLVIDSTTQGGEAHWTSGAAGRATSPMVWDYTFVTPGTYALKLKARMWVLGGSPYLYATHTRLKVNVFE